MRIITEELDLIEERARAIAAVRGIELKDVGASRLAWYEPKTNTLGVAFKRNDNGTEWFAVCEVPVEAFDKAKEQGRQALLELLDYELNEGAKSLFRDRRGIDVFHPCPNCVGEERVIGMVDLEAKKFRCGARDYAIPEQFSADCREHEMTAAMLEAERLRAP